MDILGPATVSVDVARNWARTRNAAELFVSLAADYWREAPARGGVRPEVAFAQAAKETGFGRFGGQVDASFHNPCGLKTPTASGDRPEDHARFSSWKQGVRAHLDHLALYAGAPGYPRKGTPDPRHFPAIHGTARTVERLGGKWAPSSSYGTEVARAAQGIGGGLDTPTFRQGWIAKAGRFPVVKIECPHSDDPVDLNRPRVGVMHTTEGGWASALSVFRRHYAPHFMVGLDELGAARVAQLIPLGVMGSTVQNKAGGVETNRWAHVQIEMVGFSKLGPWLPVPPVAAVLGALMGELERQCGIPLSRPFPDTLEPGHVWATESNPRRRSGKWGKAAGWWGHVEVPENEHWDPGSLQYRDLFKLAGGGPAPEPEPDDDDLPEWRIFRGDTDTGEVAHRRDMRHALLAEASKPGWGDITLRRVRRDD